MTIRLRVKSNGIVERALCGPTLHRQPDMAKAMRSRWMYRLDDNGPRLTPLGVLHTLVGLTLEIDDARDR